VEHPAFIGVVTRAEIQHILVVSVRMHGMLEKVPVDTVHAYCDSLTDCEESSEDCSCVDTRQ
jgi:hypothetical protein